jgi:integrase
VKFFKENNQRTRFLAEEEEANLRSAIGEDQWPVVEFALHTGLRRGEQFNIPWDDVDFANKIIRIRHSKNGESRHVPMNETVSEILRTRTSRLKSSWVFSSKTGQSPLDAKNYMNRVFVPALERAKINNFHWHDLRHTFASRLVMAGVDLKTVQEVLGHKTIAMTLRYSHLSPQHRLEALQRLDRRPTDTATDTASMPQENENGSDRKTLANVGRSGAGDGDRTRDVQLGKSTVRRPALSARVCRCRTLAPRVA